MMLKFLFSNFIFLYVDIKYCASKMCKDINIPIDGEEHKIIDCSDAFNTTKVIK